MIELLFEKFGDLLPLLIFIIIPLLGRVGPWLAKRAKQVEGSAPQELSPSSSAEGLLPEQRTDALQAFLRSEPEFVDVEPVPLPAVPIAPAVPVAPVVAPHLRERESLKEHLAHRGKLSMSDMVSIPKFDLPERRTRPKARTQRTVQASATSQAAWAKIGSEDQGTRQLDAGQLRQAMIWHEILSDPVSLRGPGGLH